MHHSQSKISPQQRQPTLNLAQCVTRSPPRKGEQRTRTRSNHSATTSLKMLLNHTNGPITSLILLLALLLPTVSAHGKIEGNLQCGVWMAPLEADTAAKRIMLHTVAEAAIHRLCHADRADCLGSADLLHNFCFDEEWSDDGSTHVMIDISTRNGVRQDKIDVHDCLV
ncbi:hypothetical protein MCOR18_008050, partial [Pyricularia oryzae]